jgi:hypothetical protein
MRTFYAWYIAASNTSCSMITAGPRSQIDYFRRSSGFRSAVRDLWRGAEIRGETLDQA